MKLTIVGGVPSAVPGLRLPAGAIQTTLLRDSGAAAVGEPLWLYAMEGAGGFGPAGSPLQSDTVAPLTGAAGVSALPEIVLGPLAEPNRFVVQSANAQAGFTICGSWSKANLNNLTSATDGMCNEQVQIIVELRDKQFPASAANPQQGAIAGASLVVEVTDHGGWLVLAGPLARAAILKTDLSSRIAFGFRRSSREETSIIRVYVLDAPDVRIDIPVTARAPKLLSLGTATRAEKTDPAATQWLSKPVRVGTVDSPVIQTLTGTLVPFVEIGLRNLTAGASVYPEPRAGWGGVSSLFARAPAGRKNVHFELWLPDNPDELQPPPAPVRTVDVPADDRLSGQAVTPASLPAFLASSYGGVRDDAKGVELSKVANDVQYLGPLAQTPVPFRFNLSTKLLPGAPDFSLLHLQLHCKVRMTPGNSIVDDPSAAPEDVPGQIAWTSGGPFADQQVLEIDVANPWPLPPPVLPPTSTRGANPAWIPTSSTGLINIYYKNSDRARDCFVEVTIRATIEQKIHDPQTGQVIAAPQTVSDTTILVRAFFPCPRLMFTKLASTSNNYVAIGDEGIIPVPLIDAAGNLIKHDSAREIYLEYRAEDPDPKGLAKVKPTVSARLYGGGRIHDLTLTKIKGTSEGALFRSDPIVCHLDRPEPDGQSSFPVLNGQPFQAVLVEWAENPQDRPYGLSANVTPTLNNPQQRTFWTPIRPLSFLNVGPAAAEDLTPGAPAPQITLDCFNQATQDFPVTLDKTVVPPVAVLQVSGTIRDLVGDLTPNAADRINQITINTAVFTDQTGDVQHVLETPSKLRPYAGYETFTGKVSLKPGFNIVQVTAVNKLGVTAVRVMQVELLDSRNAFDDATTMRARVTVTCSPMPISAGTPFALVQYRTPHTPPGSPLPSTFQVELQSLAAYQGTSVTDSIQVTISRDHGAGKENVYASEAILVVRDDIDPQRYSDAKQAGIQLIKHVQGTRLMVSGTLQTSVGSVPLQNMTSSSDVAVRMLVQQTSGTWQVQDRLRVGDRFTFEADFLQALNPGTVEMSIQSCDRLGRVLPGPDRRLLLVMNYDLASSTWRMIGYEDLSHGGRLVNASDLVAVSRHGMGGPGEVILRLLGGGTVRVMDRFCWSVDHDPVRQPLGGALAAQDSICGTSSRMGTRGSVVARTGELVLAQNDAALVGRGLTLSFARTYRSFLDYDGPMGYCWSHALDSWLRRLDPDTYLLVGAGGRLTTFSRTSATMFHPGQPGVYAILEIDDANVVHVRWAGGTEEVFVPRSDFDPAYLPLHARYNRCRDKVLLIYNQSGLLIRAEDPLDQPLYLHHDERQRVDSVGDGTERVWYYNYWDGSQPGGRLGDLQNAVMPAVTWAADPHRAARYSYTYDPALPHKMRGVQDPLGNEQRLPALMTMEYQPDGRVKTQQHGDGTYTFSYSAIRTDVQDRNGNKQFYTFKAGITGELDTLPQSYTAVDPPATSYTTSFSYNTQGELKTLTPPAGSMTPALERDFDETAADPRNRGNLLRLREIAIPGLAPQYLNLYQTVGLDRSLDPQPVQLAKLEWVFTYANFQLPETISDPLTRVTTHKYDSVGNLIETLFPPVATNVLGGTKQQYVAQWIYNNFGEAFWAISPGGVVIQREYYPAAVPNGGPGFGAVNALDQPTGHLYRLTVDAASVPATPQPVSRSASLTPPEARRTSYVYDAHGYLSAIADPKGNRIELHYDELGTLKQQALPDGPTHQFKHDANGRLISDSANIADLRFPSSLAVPPPPAALPSHVVNAFEYDRVGNLTNSTADRGGLNLITRREYDKNENVVHLRTPAAMAAAASADDKKRYTKHEYDGLNRLIRTTIAPDVQPQRATRFDYYSDGKIKTQTDANSLATNYFYDAFGRLVEQADLDGNSLRTWCDALGHVTVLEKYGRLDGSSARLDTLAKAFVYMDELDRKAGQADLVFRWDAGLTRHDIGRRVTEWIHDPESNVVETINARQYHSSAVFNGHGQMRSERGALTGEAAYVYDPNGNLHSVTLPPAPKAAAGVSLVMAYDAANRKISEQKLGLGTVLYSFDTLGRMRSITDQLGNRLVHEYDAVGRQTRMMREMRQYGSNVGPMLAMTVMRYEYDLNSNLLRVVDANQNKAIEYTYEAHEQVLTATYPNDGLQPLGRAGAARTTTFTHHPNGLLLSSTTPDGFVVSHQYTKAGLLSQRTVAAAAGTSIPGTTLQTFTYDGAGRCIASSDNNGDPSKIATTITRYDSLDNVWEDIQKESYSGSGARAASVQARFNAAGELEQLIYPGFPGTIPYGFDPAGRPTSCSHFASYGYTGSYLTSRGNSVNQIHLSLNQNAQGLLQDHKTVDGATGRVLGGNSYTQWNDAALPVMNAAAGFSFSAVAPSSGAFNEQFDYDSAYRLETNTRYDAQFQPTAITSVKYDATGNPVLLQSGSPGSSGESRWSTRVVNAQNQILRATENVDPNASFNWLKIATGAVLIAESLAVGPAGLAAGGALLYGGFTAKSNPGVFDYYYDARGNLIRTDYNGATQRTFVYDVFNRLTALSDNTSGTVTLFYYDAFGRRLAKDKTAFSYYGKHLAQEEPGAGGWHKHYFYASDDLVGYATDQTGTLEQYFVHDDRGGTILFLSDNQGDIRESYIYDAFGKPTVLDFKGTPVAKGAGKGNFFLHQGQYFDIETGLYCVGPRYYDPFMQRFLQPDKVLWDADTNRYAYVANNSQCLKDGSGNHPLLIAVGLMALGGFLLGAALSVAQQTLVYLDTKGESGFSFKSVLAAGAMGAACGAAIELFPWLATPALYSFSALGAYGAAQSFREGHFRAGTFDAVLAILPFWHGVPSSFKEGVSSPKYINLDAAMAEARLIELGGPELLGGNGGAQARSSQGYRLPMGERLPVAGADLGMLPRPKVDFDRFGRLFESEGQVAVWIKTEARTDGGVRSALQAAAKRQGLRLPPAPRIPDYVRPAALRVAEALERKLPQAGELHETNLFGNAKQLDVKALSQAEHALRLNHHRALPDGGFEGGTNQVLKRNLRKSKE